MKNTLPAVLPVVMSLLWGCTDAPSSLTTPEVNRLTLPVSREVTLRGLYYQNAQGRYLILCQELAQASGSHQAVTSVTDATGRLDSLYRAACQPAPLPEESVYAVLGGNLSEGRLSVTRVDTLQGKSMLLPCVPYDFWCSGTEPFWSLQISAQEGGIFLKNMGEERGLAFQWATPTTDGKSRWVYKAAPKASDTSVPMEITIVRHSCTDGMSDLRFDYSTEVKIGSKVLRGCAIRYGERVPREGTAD